MPRYKEIKSGESRICIWKVASQDEKEGVAGSRAFYAEQKTLQWQASRNALEALDVQTESMEKDEYGKPFLPNSQKHISLSHCKQFAAAIVSKHTVGIDIEEITPRVERIATRFVNPVEWPIVHENDRLTALYLLWSGKEALYKLYGKKAVDFHDHMVARPFTVERRGVFYMEFLKEKPILYAMEYEVFENHTLVWVVE